MPQECTPPGLPDEQPLAAAERLLDEAGRFAEQAERLALELAAELNGPSESEAA